METAAITIATIILVAIIVLCAPWRKGDISASLSIWRIFEFKLDAKEKRQPDANGQLPTAKS
jgi:hypothetical protein